MYLYTLYGISKLVLILCTMSIMIIMFQDIIVSRIKKAKIRKILKSYEKKQDKEISKRPDTSIRNIKSDLKKNKQFNELHEKPYYLFNGHKLYL